MHQDEGDSDSRLWGFLTPLDRARLKRMDFKLDKRAYTIGRYRGHDFRLPWSTICKTHCVVEWDGIKSPESIVKITDLSLHGTYDMSIDSSHLVNMSLRWNLVYKLGKEIGRGAYATVFKATHHTERRSYAIKVIRRDGLREFMTTDGASIYEREIAALETLFHPNICYMKEVFYTRGNISFVMEFVAGGNLWKYMGKCGRMKEPEAQRIAFQLFDAVSHRDKPSENRRNMVADCITHELAMLGVQTVSAQHRAGNPGVLNRDAESNNDKQHQISTPQETSNFEVATNQKLIIRLFSSLKPYPTSVPVGLPSASRPGEVTGASARVNSCRSYRPVSKTFPNHEVTMEETAAASLDVNFKEESSAIEQFHIRLFTAVLQQMARADLMTALPSPAVGGSMQSQMKAKLASMNLKSFGLKSNVPGLLTAHNFRQRAKLKASHAAHHISVPALATAVGADGRNTWVVRVPLGSVK
ncbi:CBL-interacting protein kinase 11 [Grifola frondosa]|uniref:CBL-interacting protein kinase 11 n=1 Tax=Grifola frondosa TaxID=5627 RepID=A0A1C7M910_GRIFR|nr:CBL-interacting protein kinase 11 [Grifola frondosa]